MTANRIMFMDLETQNNPYFGAIASPRHPDNYVVLNGWAIDTQPLDGKIEYLYNKDKAEAASRPWLHIPDDVWLLVAHNMPFEMDWALFQQRDEIQKFLQRGGRVFCTAYAHYLLSNQLDQYPALNDIAPLYGGTTKVDGVKILWEQGNLTSQIDPALLLDYLINPERGDVANTRQIFYQQAAQLQQRGMWNMTLDRCEGMLYCCYAMDAGLFVNREVAFAQRDIGEARLKELTDEFARFRTFMPPEVEFKETSDFQMSAWMFGGPIKYRLRVPSYNDDGTPKFEKADFLKTTAGALYGPVPEGYPQNSMEVLEFDHGVKFERYKAGKNKGQIKIFREDTQQPKLKWAEALFQCPPLVDLNLLPADIRKAFDREFTGKRVLADDSPVYSTGKDCLEMLGKRPELSDAVRDVIDKLDEFNKLDKDMGTYYLREEFDDAGLVVKQSGMLQFLTDMSIVHHVLNCTSTITTRLSSNKPNMQNLPRGDTSQVKNMFTSRFNDAKWLAYSKALGRITAEFYDECMVNIAASVDNGFIIEADYSALEVVTLAAFSRDTNLIKALVDGIDMHCMRLSQQLGEHYDSVKLKCKDATHPDHLRYSVMRTLIKPKAFAYQYGATAHGIAFATGCTVEDAQKFIDVEKALFPGVEAFYDEMITPVVEANGLTQREQREDQSWRLYKRGHWQAPGGTCYSFREWETSDWINGQRVISMKYKPTQIRNYPIQGESGFFVQGICGLVIRWLISKNFFNGRVYVINTVHDALYLDCHRSVLDEVAKELKRIMETLPQYFSQKYGYTLDVPFPVEVEFGRSMGEKIHWHEGVLQEKGM